MTNLKLTIWSNVKNYGAAMQLLREQTTGHNLYLAAESDFPAAEANVAFGQPEIDAVKRSTSLRWIHLDSAGYDKFDDEEMLGTLKTKGAILTTSSAVYDEPCAQHLLAMIMSLARKLPQAFENQIEDHSWPMAELRSESHLLNGQTVLLLGYGAIAKRLTELLAPLRMNLIAMRRNPAGDEPIRVISDIELDRFLNIADHVICTLPANAGTRRFINPSRLSRMKPGAIFYNIGRGITVDQEALVEALRSGHLAAAYLDVTDPEPLPDDHPLWTAENCFITPHTAGGHIGEKERLVHHFLENLRRFTSGAELLNRIV